VKEQPKTVKAAWTRSSKSSEPHQGYWAFRCVCPICGKNFSWVCDTKLVSNVASCNHLQIRDEFLEKTSYLKWQTRHTEVQDAEGFIVLDVVRDPSLFTEPNRWVKGLGI
jgi:hypothetical protein